jgi:alkylhydroperoxidase family enzyme
MLKTVMGAYGVVTAPGAFEYFTPEDVEVIFAAVSASNNCELCLSFHGMEMAGHGQ